MSAQWVLGRQRRSTTTIGDTMGGSVPDKKKQQEKILAEIVRPSKKKRKGLIEVPEDWREHWWGMPSYTVDDVDCSKRITINFLTQEDFEDFCKLPGITMTNKNSAWFPAQPKLEPKMYAYRGKKSKCKYPICIPSKGRADIQMTARLLERFGVDYQVFVEETEGDIYMEHLGEDRVVVMPFHDLGKGSIPARNFIWDYTREREHARHWIIDDNILNFGRTNFNRRLGCYGGQWFRAMEDFIDRYENIAMAGPHDRRFIPDRQKLAPYLLNHRVYSCILLKNDLDYKWRGKYNEDTDLSLRILKDGHCTLLFRAFWMNKGDTHKGDGKSGMKGGNTDTVYEKDDYRLKFVKSLQKQHPDVVELVWRYGRWHHQVNYEPFKKNKLVLKEDIVPIAEDNEYGMTLRKRKKKGAKK